TDFLGDANGELPQVWLVPDESRFWSNFPDSEDLAADLSEGDLRNSYVIDESIVSAYAMLKLDSSLGGMPLRGNLGVRAAQTEQKSSGHASVSGETLPVSFTSDYTDVLPSVNFALNLTNDLVTRVAVAKVITRPDLQDRSEEHTSELQSRENLVCRLLLEKKKNKKNIIIYI